MQYRKKKEQIAFEVIEAAIGGDAVAINQIIDRARENQKVIAAYRCDRGGDMQ